MEDRDLPTVRDVITKLKSDGTFDNFRKSCVNSIENEVCAFMRGPEYGACVGHGFFRTLRNLARQKLVVQDFSKCCTPLDCHSP